MKRADDLDSDANSRRDFHTSGDDSKLADLVFNYIESLNAGDDFDEAQVLRDQPELGPAIVMELRTLLHFDTRRAEEHLEAPLTLGDYTLRRKIGRGGMGVVYEAWEGSMDRRVALKVLPAGIAADTRIFTRFCHEAKLAGRLHHPNIVPVFGMGIKADTPHFSMEMVDGETLAQILSRIRSAEGMGEERSTILQGISGLFKKGAAVDEDARAEEVGAENDVDELEAPIAGRKSILESGDLDLEHYARLAKAFAGVAEGLQHAHSKGIIHRDIKPSNLILDHEGNLRILDFGLARLEGQETITLSGDVVGTPQYMSPEQARRKKITVDHRTDIYSLGATLYEMLTLKPPFRGKDHAETLSQIIERDPVEPRKVNQRVPQDLETIVLKCLRKEAGDRYGTAEALGQDLRRFVRGDEIEARPQSSWEKVARWSRRSWGCIAIVAAFLLCIIAGLLAFDNVKKQAEFAADIEKNRAKVFHEADVARRAHEWLVAIPLYEKLRDELGVKELETTIVDLHNSLKLGNAGRLLTSEDTESVILGIRLSVRNVINGDRSTEAKIVSKTILDFLDPPHPSPEVRAEAITAIGKLGRGDSAVIQLLRRGLPNAGETHQPVEYLSMLAAVRHLGTTAKSDKEALLMLTAMGPNSVGELENHLTEFRTRQISSAMSSASSSMFPGLSEPFSCSRFEEEFDAPTLGPEWLMVPGRGEVFLANGSLKYALGAHAVFSNNPDDRSALHPAKLVMRPIHGVNWRITVKLAFHLKPFNARQVEFRVVFGQPTSRNQDLSCALFIRGREGENSGGFLLHAPGARGSHEVPQAADACIFQISRQDRDLELSLILGGDQSVAVLRGNLNDKEAQATQWIVLNGHSWGDAARSVFEVESIRLEPHPSPRFLLRGANKTSNVTIDFNRRPSYLGLLESMGTFRENWIAAACESGDRHLQDLVWALWESDSLSQRELVTAAEGLVLSLDKSIEGKLLKLLSESQDSGLLRRAVEVLVQRGAESVLVEFLEGRELCKSCSRVSIETAIAAMGSIKGKESRRILREIILDSNPAWRRLAAVSLAVRREEGQKYWSFSAPLLDYLELEDPEEWKAVASLALGGSNEEMLAALRTLANAEGDHAERLQKDVLQLIAILPEAIPVKTGVLEIAINSHFESVRRLAAEICGPLGKNNPRLLAILKSALKDSSGPVRVEAACRLAELGQIEAVPVLESQLKGSDFLGISTALLALKRLKAKAPALEQRALELLYNEHYDLKNSADYSVTTHAAEYLEAVGAQSAIGPIRGMLDRAIQTLGDPLNDDGCTVGACQYYSFALLHLTSPDHPEAQQIYKKTLWIFERDADKRPEDPVILASLARACSLAGLYERAAEAASGSILLRPQMLDWILSNEDLAGLRKSPFFSRVKQNRAPKR